MRPQTILASALLAVSSAAQEVVVTQVITPDCLLGSAGFPSGQSNCTPGVLDYLNHICLPKTSDSTPTNPKYDASAPCVAVTAIEFQCLYGSQGLTRYAGILSGTVPYGDDGSTMPLDNTTQRNCLCESPWFSAVKGCTQCYAKHGLTDALRSVFGSSDDTGGLTGLDPANLDTFSKSYCSDTPTATQNLADALLLGLADLASSVTVTSIPTGTLTLTDPLGNKTDVSLYYTTPGPSYWSIAIPTGSPSVSNGQIVATGSTASGGPSSSTSGGASPSATGKSGAVSWASLSGGAIVALAGAVAML